MLENLRTEIAVMKRVDHENLIKLYEVISNDKHDKIYLV